MASRFTPRPRLGTPCSAPQSAPLPPAPPPSPPLATLNPAGSGHGPFSFATPNPAALTLGVVIAATATSAAGAPSEFSQAVAVFQAVTVGPVNPISGTVGQPYSQPLSVAGGSGTP